MKKALLFSFIFLISMSLNQMGCGSSEPSSQSRFKSEQKTSQSSKKEKKRALSAKKRKKRKKRKKKKETAKIKHVAVLQLGNQAKLSPSNIKYLSDLIRQSAGRLPNKRYAVMTQENLQVMLPPNKTLEDCMGECAVETGREVGADWILTGDIVKFAKEFRVTLRLHNTSTGVLEGSDVVKAGRLETLEGPLQGAAVGLFALLDPSLKRVAYRLKKGMVFGQIQFASLSSIPLDAGLREELLAQPKLSPQQMGIDFEKVDVEGLELYDRVLKLEKNEFSSVDNRLRQWKLVADRVPQVRDQALKHVAQLKLYLKKKGDELTRLKELIQKMRDLLQKDAELEALRTKQMGQDWNKLSRLLKLDVVIEDDKLAWTEAFIEAYGAIPELNPYWNQAVLQQYVQKIEKGAARYVEKSKDELESRKKRKAEILRVKSKAQGLLKTVECASLGGEWTGQRWCLKGGIQIEMVRVPGGAFMMGEVLEFPKASYPPQPGQPSKVASFYISTTEITVNHYMHCIHAGVCDAKGLTQYPHCNFGKVNRGDHPINCVSFQQAHTFAKWAGGYVPYEDQWEFATREKKGTSFYYAGSNQLDDVGWYRGNIDSPGTYEVGQKQPNSRGIYDLSGNVREWTFAQNHTEKESTQMIRGGGWKSNPNQSRVIFQTKMKSDFRQDDLGFRIVRGSLLKKAKAPKKSKKRKDVRGKRRSKMIWKL